MHFPKVSSIGSSSGPVAWTGKGASMNGMTVTNNKGILVALWHKDAVADFTCKRLQQIFDTEEGMKDVWISKIALWMRKLRTIFVAAWQQFNLICTDIHSCFELAYF
jgi:hypothetical protein